MKARTFLSILLMLCVSTGLQAQNKNSNMIENPMLWADVPDPDIIRVGDTFYLVSTTMHLMPGAPIMKSKDLKNWETIGYIFDKLTDSPKYDLSPTEGTVYGRGQWATSLKYHKGKFYALLAPNERGAMGDTYIFTADKAEGPWKVVSRMRHFHDCSLFFDDDDRVYVVYGTGEMMELKQDLSDVIEGTHRQIFQREADETGLLEGSRMIKHNGKYYLLMISHVYAPGRHRREVCYRADNIQGPYEKQTILESEFGGFSYEAQGTIVDTEDGDWYGIIFQDRGGVGRVLTVMPCRWIDGWPMLGDEEGKVPARVRALRSGEPETAIVKADDFSSEKLGLHWQWNHNPVDKAWSLTERPGYLRLKTSRVVPNLYLAPNTLTQRMEGPGCYGHIMIDLSKMKDGDCAGLAAFNSDSGVLTIKKKGKKLFLEMSEQNVTLSDRDKKVEKVEEKVIESIELKQNKIWLRIDANFIPHTDIAIFNYSLDGTYWHKIGGEYHMSFDWRRFFMGQKFGIFNYATKKVGGYVDIDEFEYYKVYTTK
ncbi:MAG: glycoside hydrolase 43 family protein [Prevotella sp.]|nr:glycoside hydrolase 43 family protein [Prevotella sp.]